MTPQTLSSVIVSGTDTDVGKTLVAAGLASALSAAYWKPIQCGTADGTDRDTVAALSGLDAADILPEAYKLATPCSPHEAALIEGVEIDADSLSLPQHAKPLVIEGAGGLMVPLTNDVLQIDVFERWQLPILLVARTTLGTINHTLTALEVLYHLDMPVLGVVFSGNANKVSEDAIINFGGVPHLGRLPQLTDLTAEALQKAVTSGVDIAAIATALAATARAKARFGVPLSVDPASDTSTLHDTPPASPATPVK